LGASGALEQSHEAALGYAVAFDIALGGVDRPVTGQELHVPERSPCPVHQLGSVGDEGTPPRVGRAALEAELRVQRMEPVHDGLGAHVASSLRPNDGCLQVSLSHREGRPSKPHQGLPKVLLQGQSPAGAILGYRPGKFDELPNFTLGVGDHRPGEPCDLSGSKAGLDAQQYHRLVPRPVTATSHERNRPAHVSGTENLCRLSDHGGPQHVVFCVGMPSDDVHAYKTGRSLNFNAPHTACQVFVFAHFSSILATVERWQLVTYCTQEASSALFSKMPTFMGPTQVSSDALTFLQHYREVR
jgi:hypothetical protein